MVMKKSVTSKFNLFPAFMIVHSVPQSDVVDGVNVNEPDTTIGGVKSMRQIFALYAKGENFPPLGPESSDPELRDFYQPRDPHEAMQLAIDQRSALNAKISSLKAESDKQALEAAIEAKIAEKSLSQPSQATPLQPTSPAVVDKKPD